MVPFFGGKMRDVLYSSWRKSQKYTKYKDLLLSKDWSSNSKVDIMVDDAVIDLD